MLLVQTAKSPSGPCPSVPISAHIQLQEVKVGSLKSQGATHPHHLLHPLPGNSVTGPSG